VPSGREQDFLDWFARSNDQLGLQTDLKSRRLLRTPDGSYTELVEHASHQAFATMRQAEAVSMIHAGLGSILSNNLQATTYEVEADCSSSQECCSNR